MSELNPSLVVLAAGLGSRYGGLKQLEPLGPGGEVLMDYGVFDAARAGVERAVFVIRREMERDFHQRLGRRYARRLEVAYAFQELSDVPPGLAVPAARAKPWGTAHAVLAAETTVRGPFVAANADDFYGAEGFRLLAGFLRDATEPVGPRRAPRARPEGPRPQRLAPQRLAMVGYELAKTLSEHGPVSRGVCRLGAGGFLASVVEHTALEPWGEGARDRSPDGGWHYFTGREPVSLNLWGLTPGVFPALRARFERFLELRGADPNAELYLPAVIDELIQEGEATVAVLPSSAQWFGVTYREDRERVARHLATLAEAGEYPVPLWG